MKDLLQKRKKKLKKKSNEDNHEINEDQNNEEEEEEEGLNVSLAAMEEKLKPKVLNDFNETIKLFKKLQKHSSELINAEKKDDKHYVSQEKI